jgi:transcriptional regulator with XRE-family HTH domain
MALTIGVSKLLDGLRNQLGLTNKDLADALNVSPATIRRWSTDAAFPQHEARENLETLLALQQHLLETFNSPEAARTWLHAESNYLGGLSPLDALRVRKFHRVEAALEALDSGAFV